MTSDSTKPAEASAGEIIIRPVETGVSPDRQLADMPKDELANLAENLALDPTRYSTSQELVAAIHERRQLIAGLDRQAMLDVIRWGRRPLVVNADNFQIALEISRIKTMRFGGLSQRGLHVLCLLRGAQCTENEPVPDLIRKLKHQEGLFAKLNRKRRAFLGSLVAAIAGESQSSAPYQFLPPPSENPSPPDSTPVSIKEEIEESGFFGGISRKIKKSADQYLNQKMDEIEARIDRKLEEIDRRLAEWRDREIANRIKILKITLWASVIVGLFSLLYVYLERYIVPK